MFGKNKKKQAEQDIAIDSTKVKSVESKKEYKPKLKNKENKPKLKNKENKHGNFN